MAYPYPHDPVLRINLESGMDGFNKAHPDILADKERIDVANQLLMIETKGRKLEELAPGEMASALTATGKRTRDWFGLKEPKEHKAASTAPRPQTEEEMRKAAIEELRRARGQAA